MKYRKKPVEVEAIQWTGDNAQAIRDFLSEVSYGWNPDRRAWVVATLEGNVGVLPGDWIVCGAAGAFSICKPDEFALTYEPVEP